MTKIDKLFLRFLKENHILYTFWYNFQEHNSNAKFIKNYDMYTKVYGINSRTIRGRDTFCLWSGTKEGREFWATKCCLWFFYLLKNNPYGLFGNTQYSVRQCIVDTLMEMERYETLRNKYTKEFFELKHLYSQTAQENQTYILEKYGTK